MSYSDDDSQNEPDTDFLIVGDQSVNIILNTTSNVLYQFYNPDHIPNNAYSIDLDDNGEDDFTFQVSHSMSMTSPFSKVGIKSLHTNAFFISNDRY